jgi:hypothetical protein
VDKKNKLDAVMEFWKKWSIYRDAASHWVLALDRLKLSSISHYERLTDDEKNRKFESTLKKHGIKIPNLWKLHQEANDAAVPVLDYFFGPNEIPVIPELPGECPNGYDEWLKKTEGIELTLMSRIIGARNRISSAGFKTKARIVPRSGWSSPYPITHWAKVFNISRKTMQNWLENNQLLARKIGSKWQIAVEELPTADDQDSSQ